MANRLKLRVLKVDAINLEKTEFVADGYEKDAKTLCAYLISAFPSGTVNAFAKLTGADPERITDVGNSVFRERGQGPSVGSGSG